MAKKYCGECDNGFLFTEDEKGNPIVTDCPKCKGNKEQEELVNKMLDAGIPPKFHKYTFNTYIGKDENKSKEKLMMYADNVNTPKFHGVGVFLSGDKSCQKTTMLCALGKELLSKKRDVKFVTSRDMTSLIVKTAGFANKEQDLLQLKLHKYINCDFLLIDDFLTFGTSSYWKGNEELIKAEWNRILRYRAGEYKQTGITCSYSFDEIEDNVSVEIAAVLRRAYKELLFKDSIERNLMDRIDKIFEV